MFGETIKDLCIDVNAPEGQVSYSGGERLEGRVSFQLTQSCALNSVSLTLRGWARVAWSSGSGKHRRSHSAKLPSRPSCRPGRMCTRSHVTSHKDHPLFRELCSSMKGGRAGQGEGGCGGAGARARSGRRCECRGGGGGGEEEGRKGRKETAVRKSKDAGDVTASLVVVLVVVVVVVVVLLLAVVVYSR
ncbi:hypothetical protein CRUP_018182, partial [Coryphaenoides rupestris]